MDLGVMFWVYGFEFRDLDFVEVEEEKLGIG